MCIQRWPLAMFSIVIQRSRPLTLRLPLMYQYRCVWGWKLGPTAADEMVCMYMCSGATAVVLETSS